MNKVPTIKKVKLAESKYNIKCPKVRNPKGICVHNTYNDASASNEVKYMQGNDNYVSFHAAIDDKEVIECLPFERSCFATGDGANGNGNTNYLSFEICYSKSGGHRYTQAEENAVWYIAKVMNDYGFPMSELKKHQDFSKKNCPHRILDEGRWNIFVDRVRWCRDELKKPSQELKPFVPVVEPTTLNQAYQVVVGSYLERRLATQVKDKLDANNYRGVWVNVVKVNGVPYYRVICGSYSSRKNADNVKMQLEKEHYTGVWINAI